MSIAPPQPLKCSPVLLLIGLITLFCCTPLRAADFSGRVTAVVSGVEIQVIPSAGQPQRIRLAGIRLIPGDPHLQASARRHLATLLGGRHIEVHPQATLDRGVILGSILHGGSDPALAMLKAGLVWVTQGEGLASGQLDGYRTAQKRARANKMGYWQTHR
jgi:endonuclease YncB( thermonuclease family)